MALFTIEYTQDGVTNDISNYIINVKLEKELEKLLDAVTLTISRTINKQEYFQDFNPSTEIKISRDTTPIFIGRVKTSTLQQNYEVTVFSCAEILGRTFANKIYSGKSPEYIFNDLITTYTDLTPVYDVSDIIIERFVAFDYVGTLVSNLAKILNWQTYTDSDKNIYFEPRGSVLSGKTVYRTKTAANAVFGKWEYDYNSMCNSVIFKGGNIQYDTVEIAGDVYPAELPDGAIVDFQVQYTIYTIQITFDGVIQDPATYTLGDTALGINNLITFDSAPGKGVVVSFNYTYSYPVYLVRIKADSIGSHGLFQKQLYEQWINTPGDARQYVTQYLAAYAEPLERNVVKVPISWITDISVGEQIRVTDDLEGINDTFVIQKIELDYLDGKLELYLGSYFPAMQIWQSQVQSRILQLNQQLVTTVFLQLTPAEVAPYEEAITATETYTEASLSYQNLNLASNMPHFDEGRGDVNDSRFSMSKFE